MKVLKTRQLVKLLLLLSNILSGPSGAAIVSGSPGHGCGNSSETGPHHRIQVDFNTAVIDNGELCFDLPLHLIYSVRCCLCL